MAASFRDGVVGLCLMAMVVVGSIGAQAQLTTQFYDNSCPQIFDIVKDEVQKAVAAEARMAASLIRVHFHDCFVNGCDGSLLLNSTATNESEQFSLPNINSIRGLNVIDTIKARLEAACPQTVSCADIVALASRDSAVEAGLTPGYAVFFGRRDSLTFSLNDSNIFLPSPNFTYPQLKRSFEVVGLDEVDLVALSGAHTIGRVKCPIVLGFQGDTTSGFNPTFLANNIESCSIGPENVTKLLNLDHTTPDTFDNWYYKNLLNGEGIIRSDQVLFSTVGGISQPLVAKFAFDPAAFAEQFALSTIKMGNLKPLTGDQGEIRLHCAFVNSNQTALSESAASRVASRVASQ